MSWYAMAALLPVITNFWLLSALRISEYASGPPPKLGITTSTSRSSATERSAVTWSMSR